MRISVTPPRLPIPTSSFFAKSHQRILCSLLFIGWSLPKVCTGEVPFAYSWEPGFHLPGLDGGVNDIIEFNDGSGLALYVAGSFSWAGTTPCQQIARWDGQWEAVGNGIGPANGGTSALAFYNDGTVLKLCAAGSFLSIGGIAANRIACWDGAQWHALGGGVNGTIRALRAHNDGSGPALFAAGDFTQADGNPANRVAKWNGSAWTGLGTGINGSVRTLSSCFGSLLCAGGSFSSAGGNPAYNVATWNGIAWTNPGNGTNGPINDLIRRANGSLYAGGSFTEVSNRNEAENVAYTSSGGQWFGYGNGFSYNSTVYGLAEYNDGTLLSMYAVGNFTGAGSPIATVNYVARNVAGNWSPLGFGFDSPPTSITAAAIGGSSALYFGGSFKRVDTIGAASIAKYSSNGWESLFSGKGVSWGYGGGGPGPWGGMAVFDDGSGPALFFTGLFASGGNVGAANIARWDSTGWSPLGRGIRGDRYGGTSVFGRAVVSYDDGSGPSLFVGGNFYVIGETTANSVAKWNGSEWSPLSDGTYEGDGVIGYVYALTPFDDGNGVSLYAGGRFDAAGGIPARSLARWDGSHWHAVGPALFDVSQIPYVYALETFDDGRANALYVAGGFGALGQLATSNIARWDGFEWAALHEGTNATIYACTKFDDGQGEKLLVGGDFTLAGNAPAGYVASWDGNTWAALGQGLETSSTCQSYWVTPGVRDLVVFDDGTGPALFAAGCFVVTETGVISSLAKWNGRHWSSTCFDFNGPVDALGVYDDGTGPALYAGGRFRTVGGIPSFGFAKWGKSLRVRGDCNNYAGLDLQDWNQLVSEMSGPDQNTFNHCACPDLDTDDRIDLRDAARWMNNL